MIDRRTIHLLSDTEMLVIFDRIARSIRAAWMAGHSGSFGDVTDLALLTVEAKVRGLELKPMVPFVQMKLFDCDLHGDLT